MFICVILVAAARGWKNDPDDFFVLLLVLSRLGIVTYKDSFTSLIHELLKLTLRFVRVY